jgi:hypothetical protein
VKSTLQRLSSWFAAQCDGRWEHGSGFEIGTLDNPGVSVDILLLGTKLEAIPFREVKREMESAENWILCRRTNERFEGRGAPQNLEEILVTFLDWSDQFEMKANQSRDPTA